jgi:hypothetical protein
MVNYENYRVKDLKDICRKKNYKGWSKLRKNELIDFIKNGGKKSENRGNSERRRRSSKPRQRKTYKPCKPDQYRHPTTNRCRKKPKENNRRKNSRRQDNRRYVPSRLEQLKKEMDRCKKRFCIKHNEWKKCYRSSAKILHPDKNRHKIEEERKINEDLFKILNECNQLNNEYQELLEKR